jgi:hypothetical protein
VDWNRTARSDPGSVRPVFARSAAWLEVGHPVAAGGRRVPWGDRP